MTNLRKNETRNETVPIMTGNHNSYVTFIRRIVSDLRKKNFTDVEIADMILTRDGETEVKNL